MARRPTDNDSEMPEPAPEEREAPAPPTRAARAPARAPVDEEAPQPEDVPSARRAAVRETPPDAETTERAERLETSATPAASVPSGLSSSLRDKRIGIIGVGAIGSALCRGLVNASAAPPNRIVVSDIHAAHCQALQRSLGVKVAESNVQIAKYTDIILLAVKPHMITPVLDEIGESLHREGKPLPLVVSIAAGVTTETIEAHLIEPVPVVRAMPNIPAQVGKGACAVCRGANATEAHLAQAEEIFRAVGIAVRVNELQMDAVTALSGSGPAYVYLMIEALVDGGVKVGLPRDIAYQLAAQTVAGAAQMVIETEMHPAQLRDMVTTPAGTTIAAIASLEHSGVRAALIDAVESATKRARELA